MQSTGIVRKVDELGSVVNMSRLALVYSVAMRVRFKGKNVCAECVAGIRAKK